MANKIMLQTSTEKVLLALFIFGLVLADNQVSKEDPVINKKVEFCSADQVSAGQCRVEGSKPSLVPGADGEAAENGALFILDEKFAEIFKQPVRVELDNEPEPERKVFVDLYGFKYNWTDPEEGWNDARRKKIFREHRRNTEQADTMPQFTKLGYKKMKMPKGLLQVTSFMSLIKRLIGTVEQNLPQPFLMILFRLSDLRGS